MSYDPTKTTWYNSNIEYLFNADIIEYDIRDAGFSLIKQYSLLPKEMIDTLEKLGKGMERHVAIGMIQRDDKTFDLSNKLNAKFAEARAIFLGENKLNDNDLISVKKDAIFTIGPCRRVNFGEIHFAAKHQYSSYIRFPNIHNLEIYYSSNGIDIKGMSDMSVNRHRLYMLEFLRKIIELIESHSSQAKRYLMNFIQEYKVHELDESFYLEFNNLSRDINPVFNYQQILIPLVQIILRELD